MFSCTVVVLRLHFNPYIRFCAKSCFELECQLCSNKCVNSFPVAFDNLWLKAVLFILCLAVLIQFAQIILFESDWSA